MLNKNTNQAFYDLSAIKETGPLTIVLPGWATGPELFDEWKLSADTCIIPKLTGDTLNEISDILKKRSDKCHIIGFSMGGFIAANLAQLHSDKISTMILIGVRSHYSPLEIKATKIGIEKDMHKTLAQFYQLANGDDASWQQYQRALGDKLFTRFSKNELMEMLDILAKIRVTPYMLSSVPAVLFMHGEFDKIAPIEEAKDIADALPQAKFYKVKNKGHFLSSIDGLLNGL